MKIKELTNNLQLLKIKGILTLRQFLHHGQLADGKSKAKYGPIENLTQYLDANKISLQLHQKDEQSKDFILKLVKLLGEYGISIELIEFEQIFTNEDIEKINDNNPNAIINLRYMVKSYFKGRNVEMSYNISDYCEILKKIEFLSRVAKSNFKEPDEQIMFVISQLSDYISFDPNYISFDGSDESLLEFSEEEFKNFKITSSLKGALLNRKTVCIGYAMALERCLFDLGYECNFISGIATKKDPGVLRPTDINHAWNQIKFNGNWYNADITFFNSATDEEDKLNCILVSDETFKYHYPTGTYEVFPCVKSYEKRKELYDKMKGIKNVLMAYDEGKRDTILQYNVADISR